MKIVVLHVWALQFANIMTLQDHLAAVVCKLRNIAAADVIKNAADGVSGALHLRRSSLAAMMGAELNPAISSAEWRPAQAHA